MNTTIMKRTEKFAKNRNDLKAACAYFEAWQRLSMLQARLELLSEDETEAYKELEKRISELGNSANLSAENGGIFRTITENEYDSMILAVMGYKDRIFSDFGEVVDKFNGKGEKVGQKVQKISAVKMLAPSLYNYMELAGNILSRLAGASMEEDENHRFTWSRKQNANDWKNYISVIKDIVSLFKGGDSEMFYGVNIGRIGDIAYRAYVQSAPKQKKNGEFPPVKTSIFVEQLTIILNQALEDADRIDNSDKGETA